MIRYIHLVALLLLFLSGKISAQVGGRASYDFLYLTDNARAAALGGNIVSSAHGDVNLFLHNPASLDSVEENQYSVNYLPFYSDVNRSSFAGTLPSERFNNWGIGVEYMGYGTFDSYDQAGRDLGQFSAREYAITVGQSHRIGPFSLGANLKLAGSHIANYNAFAVMVDAGGLYHHPDHDLHIGLVMRNFGFSLKHHTEENTTVVPADVQLGANYKLEHMPLRVYVNVQHLNTYDVQYLDPDRDTFVNEDGDEVAEEKALTEQIFRRFSFGGEFVFSDHFHLRVGYNHMRRKEMRQEQASGGAGFSLGARVSVNKFTFDYARSFYHLAGGVSSLTLAVNMGEQWKRKKGGESQVDFE